jgi:hypothetical protein
MESSNNAQEELERYIKWLKDNDEEDIDDTIWLFSESLIAIYNFRQHSTLTKNDREKMENLLLDQMRKKIEKLEKKKLTEEQTFQIERFKTDIFYVGNSAHESSGYAEDLRRPPGAAKML